MSYSFRQIEFWHAMDAPLEEVQIGSGNAIRQLDVSSGVCQKGMLPERY